MGENRRTNNGDVWQTVMRKLIKRGPKKILRMLGLDAKTAEGMNPIDYWISKDAELHEFLDKSKEALLSQEKRHYSPVLTEDLSRLYDEGNASEKAMALTVLTATKMYFNN